MRGVCRVVYSYSTTKWCFDTYHFEMFSTERESIVSYFTILNLSAVDLITGFITLPLQTAHVLVKDVIHVENKMICWTLLRLGLYPPMLSVVTLCVLSFERYMGVVHPFLHRTQVTKKRIVTFEFAAGP